MLYPHAVRDNGFPADIMDDSIELTMKKVPDGILIQGFSEIEALGGESHKAVN